MSYDNGFCIETRSTCTTKSYTNTASRTFSKRLYKYHCSWKFVHYFCNQTASEGHWTLYTSGEPNVLSSFFKAWKITILTLFFFQMQLRSLSWLNLGRHWCRWQLKLEYNSQWPGQCYEWIRMGIFCLTVITNLRRIETLIALIKFGFDFTPSSTKRLENHRQKFMKSKLLHCTKKFRLFEQFSSGLKTSAMERGRSFLELHVVADKNRWINRNWNWKMSLLKNTWSRRIHIYLFMILLPNWTPSKTLSFAFWEIFSCDGSAPCGCFTTFHLSIVNCE